MAAKQMILPLTVYAAVLTFTLGISALALSDEPRINAKGSPLAYPKRVTPPPELVSVETGTDKDEREVLVFPVVDHLRWHYDGWQWFLDRFGNQGKNLTEAVELPIMQWSSRYQPQGFEDGYRDAQRAAQRLAKDRGMDGARQAARDAYRPRLTPAPQPRDNDPRSAPAWR